MKITAKKNSKCRYCGGKSFLKFLSLGKQPPSNSFIKAREISREKLFPLDLYLCKSCSLVQLLDVVSAEYIFDKYLYYSSSSKALKEHYGRLAKYLTKRFKLAKGDVVIDIGANDGILLHGYSHPGLVLVGVEPSRVAEAARASGLSVVNEFFNKKTALRMVKKYGKAKVITATNVFAHVDNISDFVQGISSLLDEGGVFVIEAPYLIDLIDQTLFDTVYHEHLCYLSLTPMVPFLKKNGLSIFDVQRIPFGASGPAVRVFVQANKSKRVIRKSVAKLLSYEKKWGIDKEEKYLSYAKKVGEVKSDVLDLISEIKKSGATIAGYSAPAKGNTLLNYFEINSKMISFIAETSKDKQGLIAPGSHIPIVSEEEFLEKMPDYALLLSWNYLDFFLKKSEYIKKGGKFIVPLPKPKISP